MSGNNYPKLVKRLYRLLPDRWYIQLRYFTRFHRFCDLRNPSTYNEKLQWLKLNYRIAEDTILVDKYEVKGVVRELVGAEYVIPTLGVYDTVEDIDFDELPESFVLKCTHDSGGVVVVRDKSLIDVALVRDELRQTLGRNYYYNGREPHYLDIQPRIIAEPFLEDATHGQLLDYKFFCFDGDVKAMFVASDRASGNVKFDYFDADFSPLDIRQPYPNSPTLPARPDSYEEMLDIARQLSQGHPHVRVDLYEVNGHVYFGELTFFHFSGFQPFNPSEWDEVWGNWLRLPAPIRGH